MFGFHKKADAQLKQDVESELRWDPSVTFDQIKVTVDSGVVTLRGSVPHYSEKTSAEKAAQRVGGVRAVAYKISIMGAGQYPCSGAIRSASDDSYFCLVDSSSFFASTFL